MDVLYARLPHAGYISIAQVPRKSFNVATLLSTVGIYPSGPHPLSSVRNTHRYPWIGSQSFMQHYCTSERWVIGEQCGPCQVRGGEWRALLSTPFTRRVSSLLPHTTMVRPPAIRGALRGLRARPTLTPNRCFGVSARCQEKPQQSFKSQLYESTQQRLKRERAEQERFAQYQTKSSGGQYAAVIFGMSARAFVRDVFPVLKSSAD